MIDHASLYARALLVAPGGVHSPVRAFHSVGGLPIFMERASGATLTDVTGRTFIDFCQSFGPLVLGHRDPDVHVAAVQALDDGWTFGCCEPYSLALAEWIAGNVPWAESIRFVSSGTEAVMSALRVARAVTGRSLVLKFDGCYHGHADGMLVKAGSGLAGQATASSAGVSAAVAGETLIVALDDEAALDRAFDTHGGEIAAAIVEPLPANYGLLPQRADWLRHLERRCREAGSLLVFDEVISGFRIGKTGMAGLLGIRPDLVTFGKVIGGGFPVGAYAGRRALMDRVAPAGNVYQAGTLSANPVGMRAGLAALTKMETHDGWAVLERRAERFCAELVDGFANLLKPLCVVRQGSIFWIHTRAAGVVRRPDAIPAGNAEWFSRFFHAAIDRGVYLPPSSYEVGFISMAHDAQTLETAAAALIDAAHAAEAP
ncbi:MAG: glutamate-1-semialdehyde 2,1-aminomutase [Acidobacteriota bacterium]|nr:glutamate-1-semialdehyde 2,1-aminomutase [Acidobacteriota bacterium]